MYSAELCIIISQLLYPQLILTWGILYFFKSTFSMHFQHRRHPHISWSYTWRINALSLSGAGSGEALVSETVVGTTNLQWRFRRGCDSPTWRLRSIECAARSKCMRHQLNLLSHSLIMWLGVVLLLRPYRSCDKPFDDSFVQSHTTLPMYKRGHDNVIL